MGNVEGKVGGVINGAMRKLFKYLLAYIQGRLYEVGVCCYVSNFYNREVLQLRDFVLDSQVEAQYSNSCDCRCHCS